jgi:hypothetical protein
MNSTPERRISVKRQMIKLLGFAFFICSLCAARATDREFGHPFFRTFTAHDYGDAYEIYAVTEDEEGRMLFGCQDAILAFDNNQWYSISARPDLHSSPELHCRWTAVFSSSIAPR